MKDVLKSIWEELKDFFTRDWTMTEKVLVILCCVLIGVIKGFLISPVKRGVRCFSNNHNTYHEIDDDEFWLDDED